MSTKVICCYCDPPHVIREGTDPASHGLCARALAREVAKLDRPKQAHQERSV